MMHEPEEVEPRVSGIYDLDIKGKSHDQEEMRSGPRPLMARLTLKPRSLLKATALVVAFAGLAAFIYIRFPVGSHWSEIFRPAALEMLHLRNPYRIAKFFNPPWILIPFVPFALLPERLGNAVWGACTIFGFGYAARRLGASWLVVAAFLVLPHTLYNLVQMNIDWLVGLSFLMPPQIGLFFMLAKPQLGIFVALYWLIDAWRLGGLTRVSHTFGPVSVAFLLSFALFGAYLAKSQFMVMYTGKNFWPLTVPIGLILLYASIRQRKPGFALACAPLLAPYIQPYSWPVALLGFLPDNLWTIAMIVSVALFKNSDTTAMYKTIRIILFGH